MNNLPQGYVADIEKATADNTYFRQVLFTAPHSQLVVMCLLPGEDIGMETHAENDQFLRIESGHGIVIMNGEQTEIQAGSAIVIPAGAQHNIVNSSEGEMKLYTIYSPAHHPEGTIHATKAEALESEE
jgi:mannose-6-phosphate isomerase-like protein (cupin superfamily)